MVTTSNGIEDKEPIFQSLKDSKIAILLFCEYSNSKDTYISTFYFIDTEKINRIKYFLRENHTKIAHIVCSTELEKELRKALPNANYCVVKLEKYIDKERRYYKC